MPATDFTGLELVQQARIEELEHQLAVMEHMYDKAAADLIEALDAASAYRATASTMHQEIERRNGVERRTECVTPNPSRRTQHLTPDRRRSWPR